MALTAIKGEQMLAQLAERFNVHPSQNTQWKDELLQRAVEVFTTAADKRGLFGHHLTDALRSAGN